MNGPHDDPRAPLRDAVAAAALFVVLLVPLVRWVVGSGVAG